MATFASTTPNLNPAKFDGVLLLDKPSGCTSHDVVDRVRRKLKIKAVGHAGTLDPMATGLLILLIGKATKLSQYLMNLDKVYEGAFMLGASTDTYDKEGTVLVTASVPELGLEDLRAYFNAFIGDQYQLPPMFSAKKIDGQPLYKLARKGITVERPTRFISIHDFSLKDMHLPYATFQVSCSKGTYIRTLMHDLGAKIGCGAHLTALRRTHIKNFSIDQALTLETFEASTTAVIREHLIPMHKAVPDAPFGIV